MACAVHLGGAQGSRDSSPGSQSPNPRRSEKRYSRIRPAVEAVPAAGSAASQPPASGRVVDHETRQFLRSVMRSHFVFSTLHESEYDAVFSVMHCVTTSKNETVFVQDGVGDSCFFIRSGSFTVSIDGQAVRQLGPRQSFGELALLYNTHRTATVTCKEPAEVWRMDRAQFHSCMMKLRSSQSHQAAAFFGSDPNFSGLGEEDQRLLAGECSVQQFADGELILREGEVGDWMFVVMSGKVTPSDGRHPELYERRSSVILGSVGLIYGKRQASGATAKGQVICLALGRNSLAGFSGHIEDVLRRCAFKDMLHGLRLDQDRSDFLSDLTDKQQHRLIGKAEDGTFEPNEIIVLPGDPAQLVVVIDGEVAIFSRIDRVRQNAGLAFAEFGTDIRHCAEQVLVTGMGFGMQDLRTSSPMTRFAVAVGRVRLHRLTHAAVLSSLGEPLSIVLRHNEVKRMLEEIFLFKNLRQDQIEATVRSLTQRRFAAGDVVVQQGDPATHFFLIQSGTICVKQGNTLLRTLGRWDYFGERGLLLRDNCSATCQAIEECVCLVLDGGEFFKIVGMFQKELERRMHLQDLNISISDLKCKAVVGRGTFGTVRLVHPKLKEGTFYALKGVRKSLVVEGHQERSICMERDVNAQCYHPCIVQFIKTFQDGDHVYFLTEFLGGGDLFFAIREIGALSKLQCQFFSGSIALGIEYLHARGIMYRDLKPENVVLDFEGHAKLVDFGCCKKELRAFSLIGTPEYLAPEVITGKGYTCSVDWWSLGVMLHEFILGPLPFGADAEDQMALFKSILEQPLVLPASVADTDATAVKVILGLLDRRPARRLGGSATGAKEIKKHPYYAGFNWDALAGGFFEPPWRPDREQLMRNWEAPDGDLMDHVSRDAIHFGKGMEWAKSF